MVEILDICDICENGSKFEPREQMNKSKFEPREQMNRVLKPSGVIKPFVNHILQRLCCPDFYFKCFFNLVRRTL